MLHYIGRMNQKIVPTDPSQYVTLATSLTTVQMPQGPTQMTDFLDLQFFDTRYLNYITGDVQLMFWIQPYSKDSSFQNGNLDSDVVCLFNTAECILVMFP